MMYKSKVSLIALLFTFNICSAQENKKKCSIAFYNVENLFDTVDDPNTADEEFTPKGAYRYTEKVYAQKLHNIATVINKLNAVIVGLAEIENSTVLKDLVAQPELKKHNYKFAWYDSPDPRGIDVALLYNSEHFKLLQSKIYPVRMRGLRTRDVLHVSGVLQGDTVQILVNHWPSRGEGLQESIPKRLAAAQVNKKIVDSLLSKNSRNKIIIMGDMNDNPTDENITKVLGAGSAKTNTLYNPWADIYRSGKGTSVFHKKWDHFDQVIISSAWLKNSSWHFENAEIFDEDFVRNTKYADAYPFRSFNGKNWNNGYSDHLPVILHLSK